jgi:hypothetical protein
MFAQPHVIIESIGGATDGTYLDSLSVNAGERAVTSDLFKASGGGEIGREVECTLLPEDVPQTPVDEGITRGYRVVDRIEDKGNVFFQMRYFCVDLRQSTK